LVNKRDYTLKREKGRTLRNHERGSRKTWRSRGNREKQLIVLNPVSCSQEGDGKLKI
jgi:hypothetical protein